MDLIWFTRNQVVHNSYNVDIPSLLKQIKLTVKSHVQAWENVAPVHNIWKATPTCFLKANFDVSIRKSFFVISTFISNDKGEILIAGIATISSTKVNLGEEKRCSLSIKFGILIW